MQGGLFRFDRCTVKLSYEGSGVFIGGYECTWWLFFGAELIDSCLMGLVARNDGASSLISLHGSYLEICI